MKQLLIVLLIIVFPVTSNAQYDSVFVKYLHAHGDGETYHHDTLFTSMPNENHILVGTVMLPGTANQISGYDYGIWSSDVVGSECNSHNEEINGQDKILVVEMTDSSLIVNCKISANCCHDFLCDMKVDEKGVLNLIYQGYGDFCACDCCFGLTYSFVVDRYDEEMKELTGIVINGSSQTLYKL